MKLLSCLTEMIEQSGHAIIGLRAKENDEHTNNANTFIILLNT
jgi:hypothetical protein